MRERKYDFRRRLEEVHKPDRRNMDVHATREDVEIKGGWSIVISESAGTLVLNVAKDLQDYFLVSMHVSVLLRKVEDIAQFALSGENAVILAVQKELPSLGNPQGRSRSYRMIAEENRVIVCGYDDRGVGQGSYYLEDIMNLREAPLIRMQDIFREPLFTPRMAHSGWGLDRYPDAHLHAMAHAGIDSILLFVKDVDKTPEGYQDFNYLINRAAFYGIDVYMYSYLISRKHPGEPDAEAYYDNTYGKVLKACPGFKGIVLVGESCEFPSKDPKTTGMLRLEWPSDQPQTKPSPGWWPCYDYPEWLNLLKKVVRKYSENADIIFWTYNWGWAPEEDRLHLIRALPEDIILLVTFEMFEQIKHEGITNVCVDYTVSFEGPGQYFSSEAKVAHERGLTLYTMSNTGGLTWDIGVIPYEPVPYQWARRHDALLKAQQDWNLSGLMETHHFGWWPSFVSDLTKWAYWSPSPPTEEIFRAVARRDYSAEAVPFVLDAWRFWSEGIRCYIPTNEDQYGPFRVGPSYPMVFRKRVKIPTSWHAMFQDGIVETYYEPIDDARQSPGTQRFEVEIRSLEQMATLWGQGNECLEKALAVTPGKKRVEGNFVLGINRFIVHAVQTAIHVKQWWKLKHRLINETNSDKACSILEEMEQLAGREIANAEAAIPLVESDSRLGWEPNMDYMTDADHLYWKIAQVRSVLEVEFSDYRRSLQLTDA